MVLKAAPAKGLARRNGLSLLRRSVTLDRPLRRCRLSPSAAFLPPLLPLPVDDVTPPAFDAAPGLRDLEPDQKKGNQRQQKQMACVVSCRRPSPV